MAHTLFSHFQIVGDENAVRTRLENDPLALDAVMLTSRSELVIDHGADGHPRACLWTVQRFLRRRGSGKISAYSEITSRTFLRTANDMLIYRTSGRSGIFSQRLWDDGQVCPIEIRLNIAGVPVEELRGHVAALTDHLGGIPDLDARTPLLTAEHPDHVHDIDLGRRVLMPAVVLNPWIDAPDAAVVARRLFGKTRYRKPLAAAVARVDPAISAFYSLFRGLVPIDHIIDAMRGIEKDTGFGVYLADQDHRSIRRMLRGTPTPLLSRMLANTEHNELALTLRDAAAQLRTTKITPAQLSAEIERYGHRHIRSANDYEQFVLRLVRNWRQAHPRLDPHQNEYTLAREIAEVNERRRREGLTPIEWADWKDPAVRQGERERVREQEAEMAAAVEAAEVARRQAAIQQQRQAQIEAHAADAAWHDELLPELQGLALPGDLHLVVATEPDQLVAWSNEMHNCIDSYTRHLDVAILAAVVDHTGKTRLNLEARRDRGLIQFLGPRNRHAQAELGQQLAQEVFDALLERGLTPQGHCHGINGLRSPQPTA